MAMVPHDRRHFGLVAYFAVKDYKTCGYLQISSILSPTAGAFEIWRSRFTTELPLEVGNMLTKKGKYGLKAMVHLAGRPMGEATLVNDIANANEIPKKFLDTILGELRNAGLVFSKKGKGGGYSLARPAHEIKVGHIVRVLDGPLAPVACASKNSYRRCEDCADELHCCVRLVMLEARNAIATVLDSRTLAEMRALAGNGEENLLHCI
jgi:Rrf2 family protein